MSEKTIFKRIIDGEIPADVVYEDDLCLAFRDIAPQAPVHVLVIPKKEIRSLDGLEEGDKELAGHMMLVIQKIAEQLNVSGGYRLISNCGAAAGQSVDHLHFHLMAGRDLDWPPG